MITSFNQNNSDLIILNDIIYNFDIYLKQQPKILHNDRYQITIDQYNNLIELKVLTLLNTKYHKPIYIVNNKIIKYKLTIIIEPNAKAAIIDHKIQRNTNTEIICAQNSIIDYYLIQKQDNSIINIIQDQHSNFNGRLLATSEDENHLQLNVELLKPYAKTSINILQHTKLQASNSIALEIKHLTTNTESNTVARIIADHRSTANLTGKIKVAKNAKNTNANLQSKGLIISKQAAIINRPELNIEHNEVRCSHGVSVGDLDPNALLYMQTRGIDREIAVNILLEAFKHPILETIKYQEIIKYLNF